MRGCPNFPTAQCSPTYFILSVYTSKTSHLIKTVYRLYEMGLPTHSVVTKYKPQIGRELPYIDVTLRNYGVGVDYTRQEDLV